MKPLSKELRKAIKSFASRFSFDDWQWLCTKMNFLDAIESGQFDQAEVIAHELLANRH